MREKSNPIEMVSVVVGRFQVAELTQGHIDMLQNILDRGYGTNVLILGLSPLKCTANNPLDYEARRLMIEQQFPGRFDIHYLKDTKEDSVWSSNFDRLIDDIKGNRDVVLIGSRDCFYDNYNGKYKNNFEEYRQVTFVSGTEQRKSLSKQIKNSKDWRAGLVYGSLNRYPTVYSTVDCAIFDNNDLTHLYLAKKLDESKYRFVGGFSDPRDDSFETSARREASEETKLETNVLARVCSMKVDDWRYKSEQDKIITQLFVLVKCFGRAEASDDICEIKLFKFDTIVADRDIVPEHVPLFNKLKEWWNEYQSKHPNFSQDVNKQLD